MEATESETQSALGVPAVERAWKAHVSPHYPHDRLVLLAVASLCDEGHVPDTGRETFVAELGNMTGLAEWKVAEILRTLLRDGHLCQCGCILGVV